MRSDARAALLVVVTAAVLVVAVIAAAVAGPWELEPRDFGFGDPPPVDVDVRPPWLPPIGEELEPGGRTFDLRWLYALARILLTVLAVLAAVLVARWLWLRLRGLLRDVRRPAVGEGAGAAAADEPELPILRRGAGEAQRLLAQSTASPADAVIAAWLALEDAARDSGVRRTPSQTPTEFTAAVLERTSADPEATAQLLGLYHQARFSTHPVGTAEIAAASWCVARLAAGWEALATRSGDAS